MLVFKRIFTVDLKRNSFLEILLRGTKMHYSLLTTNLRNKVSSKEIITAKPCHLFYLIVVYDGRMDVKHLLYIYVGMYNVVMSYTRNAAPRRPTVF